jgi:RNA polymerase sigma factor (sigma-70 family)
VTLAATSAAALPSAAAHFQAERTRLFGLAYRMTGSVVEAEDIVQDAWLRFAPAAAEGRSPAALLTTIVTRLCIDHMRSARVRREQYVGEWLPEPLHTRAAGADDPEGAALGREALDYAFLVLLERLRPVERAVVVLHEAFELSHREIAEAVGISEGASRQNLRRARQRLREAGPRAAVDRHEHARVTAAFIEASRSGEIETLARLLAHDAVFVSDGGGVVPAALNPVAGRDRVARLLMGLRGKLPRFRIEAVEVNGGPGFAVYRGSRLDMVYVVEVSDGLVAALRGVRNPQKLQGFAQPLAVATASA